MYIEKQNIIAEAFFNRNPMYEILNYKKILLYNKFLRKK